MLFIPSKRSLAASIGVGSKEGEGCLEKFHEQFPGIRGWVEKVVEDAKVDTFIN